MFSLLAITSLNLLRHQLMGLAVYNSIALDIHFPLYCYRCVCVCVCVAVHLLHEPLKWPWNLEPDRSRIGPVLVVFRVVQNTDVLDMADDPVCATARSPLITSC